MIFRRALTAVVFSVGLGLAGPVLADTNTNLTKSAFKYNSVRYFRGKSENVQLGSYGQKKTPVGQPAYLAVQAKIKTDHLEDKIKIAGPVTIDWNKESKTDVEANVKYLTVAGGKANFTHQAAKSANLKLVKFYLNEGALKGVLNNKADGARNYLRDEGNDGRVVSEVWVVMEAELANQVTNSGSVTVNGTSNGFDVEVKTSSSTTKTTKLSIAPDTTFAYLMHKVKKWGNKKTEIEDLEDDMAGLN